MRDGLEQWMQNPVITVSLSNKLARERYSFLSLSLSLLACVLRNVISLLFFYLL